MCLRLLEERQPCRVSFKFYVFRFKMPSRSYKDLEVWKKGFTLVEVVYTITERLPKEELYGLSSQIRRASVSIPSNIAEGQRRKNAKEFIQFLYIADGSTAEVETQLMIMQTRYNLDVIDALTLVDEIQKMLYMLIKKLKT